jgi:hypothetical protein
MNFLKRFFTRKKTFTLVIREPFSDETTVRETAVTGQPLVSYLGDAWRMVAGARVRGRDLDHLDWFDYMPSRGEVVELKPASAGKTFSDAYIAAINARDCGGKLLKAIILTETISPLVKRFFVDHDSDIVYDGATYKPLAMSWQGLEISRQMSLPTMKITVPNMGHAIEVAPGAFRSVADYVHSIDVLEHDVTVRTLHLGLLGDLQAKDDFTFQLQMIDATAMAAVFTVGLNLGLKDTLPRNIMTRAEFPGIQDTIQRFSA